MGLQYQGGSGGSGKGLTDEDRRRLDEVYNSRREIVDTYTVSPVANGERSGYFSELTAAVTLADGSIAPDQNLQIGTEQWRIVRVAQNGSTDDVEIYLAAAVQPFVSEPFAIPDPLVSERFLWRVVDAASSWRVPQNAADDVDLYFHLPGGPAAGVKVNTSAIRALQVAVAGNSYQGVAQAFIDLGTFGGTSFGVGRNAANQLLLGQVWPVGQGQNVSSAGVRIVSRSMNRTVQRNAGSFNEVSNLGGGLTANLFRPAPTFRLTQLAATATLRFQVPGSPGVDVTVATLNGFQAVAALSTVAAAGANKAALGTWNGKTYYVARNAHGVLLIAVDSTSYPAVPFDEIVRQTGGQKTAVPAPLPAAYDFRLGGASGTVLHARDATIVRRPKSLQFQSTDVADEALYRMTWSGEDADLIESGTDVELEVLGEPLDEIVPEPIEADKMLVGNAQGTELEYRDIPSGALTAQQAAKLAGIEAGATADQTGAEIKAELEGLQGNARLQASAIQGLPAGGGGTASELAPGNALPAVAGSTVGDIFNLNGDLYELVDSTDDPHIVRGVATQQIVGWVGTQLIMWRPDPPGNQNAIFLSRIPKALFAPTVVGNPRPNTIHVRISAPESTAIVDLDYEAAQSAGQTFFQFASANTGIAALDDGAGAHFTAEFFKDGALTQPLAVQSADRWEPKALRDTSAVPTVRPEDSPASGDNNKVWAVFANKLKAGWRNVVDLIANGAITLAKLAQDARGGIPSGADFPADPVENQRFKLTGGTTIQQDHRLAVTAPSQDIKQIQIGGGAGLPAAIIAYSNGYSGTGDAALRNHVFIQYGGARTKTSARLILHSALAARVTYGVSAASAGAGLEHFYQVNGLDFDDLQVGGRYYLNVEFDDGSLLWPGIDVGRGIYQWTAALGWTLDTREPAWWATQGHDAPWTLAAQTTLLEGPGTGLSVQSLSQDSNGVRTALQSHGEDFDLDDADKQAGFLMLDVRIEAENRSSNTIGFSPSGLAEIRMSGFHSLSSIRSSDVLAIAQGRFGVEVDSLPVYKGANAAGTLKLFLARNANNVVDYWLRYEEGGAQVGNLDFGLSGTIVHDHQDPAGGAEDFTDLGDVPADYNGQAGKYLKVKATADGLEFGDGGAGFAVPSLYEIGIRPYAGGTAYAPGPPVVQAANGTNRKYIQPSPGATAESAWSTVSLVANNVAESGVTVANDRIVFAQARRCTIKGNIKTEVDGSGGAARVENFFRAVKQPNTQIPSSLSGAYFKTTAHDASALTQGGKFQITHFDFDFDANAGDQLEFHWMANMQTSGENRIVAADSQITVRFFA